MTSVTPSSPAVPAGWYRDPLGIPQLRWWDGFSWTNRIQEDQAETASWNNSFDRARYGYARHSVA